MKNYLVLKLEGPFQAWGKETFEGLRPSASYPGRSALLGLVGACLGIDCSDREKQRDLATSIEFAVRIDPVFDTNNGKLIRSQIMTDYHTVKDARESYRGLKSHNNTIQTWREYWQDIKYTVLVWELDHAIFDLKQIEQAVKKPIYTPVLGRRSCVLSRPLFEGFVQAYDIHSVFSVVEPNDGTIFSPIERDNAKDIPLRVRDVAIINQPRQFASRMVYMTKPLSQQKEGT